MRRTLLILLALVLLSGGATAEGYNSFTDDYRKLGIFDQFVWDGLYVYWLRTPNNDSWTEPPANLYRMVPGGLEAELLLEGREDLYIYGLLNIKDRLLLSVANEKDGQTHPALINFDGSGYQVLPGNIGSVVTGDIDSLVPDENVIYNSVDGSIYEIPLDSMKPRRIYKYPKDVLNDNPRIIQCVDGKLYFGTDTHEWYELDIQSGMARRFAQIRGNGFVMDGMFYVADFDTSDGTWKYDISTGNRMKLSDTVYDFKQGMGGIIRAMGDAADGWFQGVLFDFSYLKNDLEEVKILEWDENYTYIAGNKFIYYDWQKNRVDLSKRLETDKK